MDKPTLLAILLQALDAAPYPQDCDIESLHPEDAQKWCDRYKIWYKDIRTPVLQKFEVNSTHHLYYQIDRLVQASNDIQKRLNVLPPDASEPIVPERATEQSAEPLPAPGISIGKIKKT